MSKYEWATGELTLPSAAVTQVKRALREATNQMHEDARRLAADFWDNHAKRTRSAARYRQALETYLHRPVRARSSTEEAVLFEGLDWALEEAAQRPHKLTVAEIDKAFPKATSKTSSFGFGEASISINGRNLRWHISENNRAVERAHGHPLFIALMRELSRVKWTRGTGGRSWGSDEYAMDAAQNHGGDPVETRQIWGPLGERHEEAERRAWMAAAGYGPRGGRRRR